MTTTKETGLPILRNSTHNIVVGLRERAGIGPQISLLAVESTAQKPAVSYLLWLWRELMMSSGLFELGVRQQIL